MRRMLLPLAFLVGALVSTMLAMERPVLLPGHVAFGMSIVFWIGLVITIGMPVRKRS